MSAALSPAQSLPKRALGLLKRRWGTVVIAVGAVIVATPMLELSIGTRLTTECLAGYESPRGPEPPDCADLVGWFVVPSRAPWTLTSGRYRAEEFGARIRIDNYIDAIVGRPDRARLEHAALDVDAAQQTLAKGSQRLALEELGRSVGAPDLGKYADAMSDRTTLLRESGRWTDWPVRMHTIEAALLEGDVPRAAAIAQRYAEFDPRDEDLRTAVAAMLCLAGDASRGVELLKTVQADRAAERHAAMSRDWGEVRAMIVECSALIKTAPPPKPTEQAGQADAVAARAVLRLKLASDEPARTEAIDAAIAMLHGPIKAHGGRLALLAEVIASGTPFAPEIAAEIARPRIDDGEAPLVPTEPLTVRALLEEPVGIQPTARTGSLIDAADMLVKLAGHADVSNDVAVVLRDAAGVMLLAAGADIARAGRPDEAVRAMRLGGVLALGERELRAIARSSAWYVAGDAARALAELDGDADADVPALDSTLAHRAALGAQRAEILASLGKHKDAGVAAVAADALGAEAAAKEEARAVSMYTRWTRLALAREDGHGLRENRGVSADFRWIGFAEITAEWARPRTPNEAAIEDTLGAWARAVELPPEGRRALRYQVFHRRGDAPPAHVAYLALGGDLLGEGEGDVEIWLDAFDGVDARRMPLRAYAWYRAEAARWRGDADAAKKWSGRFHTLAALAADPSRVELTQHLGI